MIERADKASSAVMVAHCPPNITRLCVKNIPKHCNEVRLRKHFEPYQVNDVRVMRTKDGRPRNFGFLGFHSAEAAEQARIQFNNSYMDMSKISVEAAQSIRMEDLVLQSSRNAKRSERMRAEGRTPTAADRVGATKPAAGDSLHSDPKLSEFLKLMQPNSTEASLAVG